MYALLGYFRDYIFININFELSYRYYNETWDKMPIWINLLPKSYMQLYYLKYVLTFIFIVIFSLLTCGAMYMYFKEKKQILQILVLYALVVLIAFACNQLYRVGFSLEQSYLFSRQLMGIVESPILTIIIFIIYFLEKNFFKNDSKNILK